MKLDRTTVFGLALVAAAAAVLTFTTLTELALDCGFGPWLAWLLPLTVDAAGLVALRVWLRNGPQFAKRLTLVCIGLSVAGNATQHGLAAYYLPVPWWVIVVVSAVPPAMLASVVHLAHRVADRPGATSSDVDLTTPDRAAAQVGEVDHPVEVPGPVHEPLVLARPANGEPAQVDPDHRLDDLVRWIEADGVVPSSNAVIKRYGVGRTVANRLLADAADRSPVAA